ncbi:hypothetical protein F5Y12DRAFT_724044 [Xylaria sp. FL1777]|nr:hypothetical protein F5Y12DRAFT_724044 [Xylaria sp. FL1777]
MVADAVTTARPRYPCSLGNRARSRSVRGDGLANCDDPGPNCAKCPFHHGDRSNNLSAGCKCVVAAGPKAAVVVVVVVVVVAARRRRVLELTRDKRRLCEPSYSKRRSGRELAQRVETCLRRQGLRCGDWLRRISACSRGSFIWPVSRRKQSQLGGGGYWDGVAFEDMRESRHVWLCRAGVYGNVKRGFYYI